MPPFSSPQVHSLKSLPCHSLQVSIWLLLDINICIHMHNYEYNHMIPLLFCFVYIASGLTTTSWTTIRAWILKKCSTYYIRSFVDLCYKLYLLFSWDSQASECACFRGFCLFFPLILTFQHTPGLSFLPCA